MLHGLLPDQVINTRKEHMSEYDPFEAAPTDDEAQADTTPASEPESGSTGAVGTVTVDVKPNILPGFPVEVVGTLKGDGQPPWIVIHAPSLQEYYNQVSGDNAALLAKAMEQTQKAGKHFASLGGGSSAPARHTQPGQPAGSVEPPAGSPPCPGPGWVFKSGVGKSNGKPWKGWMPPQGSNEKPVFF